MSRRKIVCVVGTRPEVVKMAPIVRELRTDPEAFEVKVLASGQHRDLLDQMLDVFDLVPDADFNVMKPGQTLTSVTVDVLQAAMQYLEEERPDVVLAEGDTTTVMSVALACFYNGTRFGHVEAGLRTGDLREPFPEEFNRHIAGLAAAYNFAPTSLAAENLRKEGVPEETIFVTGNTVIDALQYIVNNTSSPQKLVPAGRPYILMTCHRREIFGEQIREVFSAVRTVAEEHPEVCILYPVHPNPNVSVPAQEMLGRCENIVLSDPLNYVAFVHAMQDALFVLSDSGGIQEEAPSLGKPVLVLRDKTERPEAVKAGTSRLVGPHHEAIVTACEALLARGDMYKRMARVRNPYGDGQAAARMHSILRGEAVTAWDDGLGVIGGGSV